MKHYRLNLDKFATFIGGVAVIGGSFAIYLYMLLQIATPL